MRVRDLAAPVPALAALPRRRRSQRTHTFLKLSTSLLSLASSIRNSASVLSAMFRWLSSSDVTRDTRDRCCSFFSCSIPAPGGAPKGQSSCRAPLLRTLAAAP